MTTDLIMRVNVGTTTTSADMWQPEIPAVQRQPALLLVLTLLVVPICVERFNTHYSGQPAL